MRARSSRGGERRATWLSELVVARVLRADPVASAGCRRDRSYRAGVRSELALRATTASASQRGAKAAPGIPIVDAAMRELDTTGYMHNRLRMVAASFLVKDLLVRLALGRALLRRQADRLRPRVEQRRLAVGGVHRLRRAAVLPHLQSGRRSRSASIPTALHPALRVRSFARLDGRDIHAPWKLRWKCSGHGVSWSAAIIRRRSSTTPRRARCGTRDVQGGSRLIAICACSGQRASSERGGPPLTPFSRG